MVFPLSAEIAHELPAPEVVTDRLGLLDVLDRSKVGAQSLFYLPSSPYGLLDQHHTVVILGSAVAERETARPASGFGTLSPTNRCFR